MAKQKDARGSSGNVIAAVCSVFVPGLGQLVQGRLLAAAFYFLVVNGLYALAFITLGLAAIPAFVLHVISILAAARYQPR